MRRASLLLLAPLFLLLISLGARPSPALAHGVLVRASISPGSLLANLPPALTLTFSESLATRFSSLTVVGPDGTTVSSEPAAQPDDRSLRVRVRPGGGGTYGVFWSSVSAEDGHVLAGAFSFAVAFTSAPNDLALRIPAHGSGALGVSGLLATITYWLLLVLAIAWAGGALLEMPLGASASRPALSGGDAWITTLEPHARGVRNRLLEILLGLLAFSWLLQAAQLATAGRVSLLGGLLGLVSGHLGAQRVLMLLVVVLALLDLRGPAAPNVSRSRRTAGNRPSGAPPARGLLSRMSLLPLPPLGRWGHLALAALFLLALAAGSHAGGIPSITLSAVLLEWLHSLAAAAWVGGLAYLSLSALPVLENLDLDKRAPLLLGLLRRYTPFAGSGIAILAITGLFATQVHVGTRARLAGNPYGNAFLLKMALVAAGLALTFYLLGVQRRYVERTWTQRQRLESLAALDRVGRTLRIGALFGALILGATAALWADTPATSLALPARVAFLPPIPSGVWQPVGLQGTVVHRILFAPDNRHVLWAATSTGVWRSIDDQRTWKRRGTLPRTLDILDLLFLDHGRGLLAAGTNGQLYRTYDAGAHWQRLGKPFGRHPLRTLAAHGRVLLAGGDDGLFRSTDDSRHWHRVLTVPGQGISTLIWSSIAGRFLAGVQRGPWQIYNAAPDAASWHALAGAPGSRAGVLALASSGMGTFRFIAGAGGAGAWAAPAPVGSWTPVAGIAGGSTVDAILPDTRVLGRLYLGTTDAGAYASADGGTSWVALGQNSPKDVLSLAMRPGPVPMLYAATSDGIYKLTIGA